MADMDFISEHFHLSMKQSVHVPVRTRGEKVSQSQFSPFYLRCPLRFALFLWNSCRGSHGESSLTRGRFSRSLPELMSDQTRADSEPNDRGGFAANLTRWEKQVKVRASLIIQIVGEEVQVSKF